MRRREVFQPVQRLIEPPSCCLWLVHSQGGSACIDARADAQWPITGGSRVIRRRCERSQRLREMLLSYMRQTEIVLDGRNHRCCVLGSSVLCQSEVLHGGIRLPCGKVRMAETAQDRGRPDGILVLLCEGQCHLQLLERLRDLSQGF